MEYPEAIAQTLYNLAALWSRESDQILQERLSIGLSQYKILAAVQQNARVQQRQIAVELGQTEASVSRQVKLLQDRGMITSRKNPRNKREHLTELTPKGSRVAEAAYQSLATYHSSLVSHISRRQQEVLLSMLSELR
jgi:MarR family transcriptional regulator for hemolysin